MKTSLKIVEFLFIITKIFSKLVQANFKTKAAKIERGIVSLTKRQEIISPIK